MTFATSVDVLYSTIGTIAANATGRTYWDKRGIQAQPQGPYATVYLAQGQGVQNPVVERVILDTPGPGGELIQEIPWGTQIIKCQVEFLRSAAGNTAIQAANRFANSLRLSARMYDLWQICGLLDATQIIDISALFRADIEPRARVEFSFYANIAAADYQSLENNDIFDIEHQPFEITVQEDGETIEPIISVTLPS